MGRAGGNRKLPVGIRIRQNQGRGSIQIAFSYRGVECRETLRLEPTPANIRYAERLRSEILSRIARHQFDYAEFFPDSKRAGLFSRSGSTVTLTSLLDQFLSHAERTLEPSTVAGYRKVCRAHLYPRFGQIRVSDLTPAMLREWMQGLRLTAKRVRNILTPLRAVLEQAMNDELIDRNPLDAVVVGRLLPRESRQSRFTVDPFTPAEIRALLSAARPGHERNFWRFAFYSGLRTSELIALEWGDIDFVSGLIRVSRAQVERKTKGTKTQAGTRDVVVLPPARAALQDQKALTFLEGGRIFRNPATGQSWATDAQIRRTSWQWLVKRAGVRYRNPYQTRHTYASMLLSAGANELWVAAQMGHRDVSMVRRHYGRWIPNSQVAPSVGVDLGKIGNGE